MTSSSFCDARRRPSRRAGDARSRRSTPPRYTRGRGRRCRLPSAGAGRGNPVHDLLVDRDADGRREPAVALEGRRGAPRSRMNASTSSSISRVDIPGLTQRPQALHDVGQDVAGPPHERDLARPTCSTIIARRSTAARRIASRIVVRSAPSPATVREQAALAVVVEQRRGLPLVHLEPIRAPSPRCRPRAGRARRRSASHTPVAPRRRRHQVERRSALAAHAAAGQPAQQLRPRTRRSTRTRVERLAEVLRACASSASAWAMVRGKPSRMKPGAASGSAQPLARSSPIIDVVGDQRALVHVALGLATERRPAATASRSMSPVDDLGHAPLARRARGPGCPCRRPGARGTTSRTPQLLRAKRARSATSDRLQEALVVAHEQVRFHLAHGVERHADHDQQAGAAEVERHVEPADQDVGQHARSTARKSAPGSVMRVSTRSMYSAVFLPGPDARDEAAVLLHVVGEVDRVEDDRRVEVGEEDDERHVEHGVGAAGPGDSASAIACSHGCGTKRVRVAGNRISDEAKMTGMTPAVLIAAGCAWTGRRTRAGPTTRLAYCTGILRCPPA